MSMKSVGTEMYMGRGSSTSKWLLCAVLAISMLVLLAVPALGAMVRQPYLQQTTPTSVVIMWRTDLASGTDSRVQYGANMSALDSLATGGASIPGSNGGVYDHVVSITGLNPATKYYYNVGTDTDGVQAGGTDLTSDGNHYFITHDRF